MSTATFASVVGVSRQHLCDLYHERRAPGPSVLEFLGLQRAICRKS